MEHFEWSQMANLFTQKSVRANGRGCGTLLIVEVKLRSRDFSCGAYNNVLYWSLFAIADFLGNISAIRVLPLWFVYGSYNSKQKRKTDCFVILANIVCWFSQTFLRNFCQYWARTKKGDSLRPTPKENLVCYYKQPEFAALFVSFLLLL